MHAWRQELNRYLGFEPMDHRPPLSRRWWLYCVVAYLAPPILLALVPIDDVPHRDLVWLITLVPAFVLSLQYGMHGATTGLLMGWTLFLAVQFIDYSDLNGGDWRITTPIYVAYSALALSVGWLSEQLHVFYKAAIDGERIAVVRQLAIAIQHEAHNALAAIRAEAQLMSMSGRLVHPEDQQGLHTIHGMSARIGEAVARLVTVSHAPVTDYLPGKPMVDLTKIPLSDSAEEPTP